jgi:hypothetical protein
VRISLPPHNAALRGGRRSGVTSRSVGERLSVSAGKVSQWHSRPLSNLVRKIGKSTNASALQCRQQAMGLILADVLIALAAAFGLLALLGVLTNEQRLAVTSLVVAIGALALLVPLPLTVWMV